MPHILPTYALRVHIGVWWPWGVKLMLLDNIVRVLFMQGSVFAPDVVKSAQGVF